MTKRILYVTTDWNTPHRIATGEYGGVGYYRAYGPAKELKHRGWSVDVKGYELGQELDKDDLFASYMRAFEPYDMVVVKQADTSNAGKLIGACKELDIPIAMDLDDLITELDPDNPALDIGYGEGDAKKAMAVASLSMVDALFTSTQPLADEYVPFLKKVMKVDMPTYVLPNCVDPTLWTKQKREDDEHIIIGWQGSITHDGDIGIVLPAMYKLLKEYDNVVLSFTGGMRLETYDRYFRDKLTKEELERVVTHQGTPSFKHFPEYLARHQWDIGIVPLKDTKFSRGKSHIKWLENSLVGVPTIASDVYPYTEPIHGTDVLVDGETGIISKDEEWFEKIEYLIKNPKERKRLAKNAHQYVKNHWQYSHHIHLWEEAFTSVLKEGSKSLS